MHPPATLGRMVRLVHVGNWDEGSISLQPVPSGRKIEAAVETAIAAAWASAAARPGIHLFDGPMCRLESFEASADSLRLLWSPTSYRIFLGTNMAHPEFADRFGPAVMDNPIGLSVAILTANGQLLLGRRNQSVAYYPGRVHPVAGCLEPTDASPFAGIRRELREELSLHDDAVTQLRCVGLAEDAALRQVEMIFAAEVSLPAEQVAKNLDPSEHRGLWQAAATEAGITAALGDVAGFTPVAVATLLLTGRLRFGLRWFHQNAKLSSRAGAIVLGLQRSTQEPSP